MKIGYFGANVGGMAAREARGVAELAEELGYSSMWTGEHMVLPIERPDYLRLPADWAFADPLVMLGYLAACTERIELCTGVLLLPQRHPVQLAKEIATVDVLCAGRLRVGVGIGHLTAEMDALDVPPARRLPRAMESLDVMAALWRGDPSFAGEHYSFTEVAAYPRPFHAAGPPIIMGGWSEPALRRAARRADGWYGFGLSPSETTAAIGTIRAEAATVGRDLSGFRISLTPTMRLDPSLVTEFAEAGVDELVVSCESDDLDGVERRLRRNAPAELGVT